MIDHIMNIPCLKCNEMIDSMKIWTLMFKNTRGGGSQFFLCKVCKDKVDKLITDWLMEESK
jgi:uncharacterized protein YlaI